MDAELSHFIPADPNEGLEIGMDRNTRVGKYPERNGFVGLMRRVRVYNGSLTPEQVKGLARE